MQTCYQTSTYYVPATRTELITFLKERLTVTKSSLMRLHTKQLYAIYHNYMREALS